MRGILADRKGLQTRRHADVLKASRRPYITRSEW
jgi:hypothetical protein